MGVCARPWIQAADQPLDLHGRHCKIHVPQFFVQHSGLAGKCFLLGNRFQQPLFQQRNGTYNQFGSALRQFIKQCGCRFFRFDHNLPGHEHITGINPFIHLHDGDTGFLFSVDDGPVDGRCTSVLRQQRSMDIHASETGHMQNLTGQNLSERCHNKHIRIIAS